MKATNKNRMSTETMVLGAIMTALVIVLQCLSTTPLFGPFSTAVALIPIVIGAAMCGPAIGTWLGAVFGFVVLATQSAGVPVFLGIDVLGTIVTVMVKGVACGFAAGLTYKLLTKANRTIAAIASSIVCPIVNTGVFLLGCAIFFLPHDNAIAEGFETTGTGMGLFLALAGGTFLFELGMSIVLSPVIVRLLDLGKKGHGAKHGEG